MLYQVTIPIASNLPSNTILNLGDYISNIVGVILIVAAVAAFVYLVWGGVSWITAGGDKGKIEEARNRITGAIVGLTIVALSWAIFLLLDWFFGINIAGGNSTPPTNAYNSSSNKNNNLASFTGVANCRCANNGCAKLNTISQLSGANDCRICTTSGWSGNKTTYPQLNNACTAYVQCGQCP